MITDELERLAALHRGGSLTDAEFAAAKRRLLADSTLTEDDPARQLALTQLDVDWVKLQQSYLRGRRPYLPSESTAAQARVLLAILIAIGLFFGVAVIDLRPFHLGYFLLISFGILLGIFMMLDEIKRTRRYLGSERKYQMRREQIIRGAPDWDEIAAKGEVQTSAPSPSQTAESTLDAPDPAGPPRIHPRAPGFAPTHLP